MSSFVHHTDGESVHFVGQRCTQCGLLVFPSRARCSRCLGRTFEESLIEPIGELYSFTVVHVGRPGSRTPYAIGVADFPENIRVIAQIVNWEFGLEIGQRVTAGVAAPGDQVEDERGNIRIQITGEAER